MRIMLVAALATVMCASAGLAQTTKQKSPHVASPQLSPAERARCKETPRVLSAANRRACRSIGNAKRPTAT
jgi:hypothetical protein